MIEYSTPSFQSELVEELGVLFLLPTALDLSPCLAFFWTWGLNFFLIVFPRP